MSAFATSDGEAIVLNQVFSTDALEMLKSKMIGLGKISASCSGIHQPSDVSPLFKGTKKASKKYMENPSLVKPHPLLTSNLRSAFANLESSCGISISAGGQKEKIILGCEIIVRTLQEVVRPRLITDGFALCGQYPLNFETVMRQSYTKLTPENINDLKKSIPDDEAYFRQHGELTEEQLDKSNIPTVYEESNTIPRNNRPLANQRAALITHPETVARQQAYFNSSLDLGSAILALPTAEEERKLAKTAAKEVAKEVAKDEKRKIKKQKEIQRKASMTKEQLDEEKRLKKVAADEKKAEKQANLHRHREIVESLKSSAVI